MISKTLQVIFYRTNPTDDAQAEGSAEHKYRTREEDGNDRGAIRSMARQSQSTLGTIRDVRPIRLYDSVWNGDTTPVTEESTTMRLWEPRITAGATLLRQ